ncbi:hypothetical protein GGR56DRAFT_684546 [Xylariaceae sp. FL0804]|nr:hypothetical protein GGR56DRAFT_684546 [Xylariaceae sp. FL0804]
MMLFGCEPKKKPCKVSTCRRRRHTRKSRGLKEHSNYCSDHTCKFKASQSDHTICLVRKRTRHLFCSHHRKCGWPGCEQEGENGSVDRPTWYCRNHRCDAADCMEAKFNNRCTCWRHTHCEEAQCEFPRNKERPFCKEHLCEVADCRKRAYGGQRCFEHIKCSAPDCERTKANVDRYNRPVCDVHGHCEKTGCQGMVNNQSSPFCEGHRCNLSGCRAERREREGYCDQHACRYHHGCKNPVVGHPTAFDRPLYCQHHRCPWRGCGEHRRRGMPFCWGHTCQQPGCTRGRAAADDDSRYCDGHKCRVGGCPMPRGHTGDYCIERHACAHPNCPQARVMPADGREFTSGVPQLCLDHLDDEWRQQRAAGGRRRADPWPPPAASETQAQRISS